MGFFKNFFKGKTAKKRNFLEDFELESYEFTQKTRQKRQELKQIELEIDIETAKQELNNIKMSAISENPDHIFMQLITNLFNSPLLTNKAKATSEPSINNNNNLINMSREDILAFFDSLPPEHKAIIKYSNKELVLKEIAKKIPNISQESLILCSEIIDEKKQSL